MQTVSVNAGKSYVDIEINLVCKVIARARVVTVLFPKFSSEFRVQVPRIPGTAVPFKFLLWHASTELHLLGIASKQTNGYQIPSKLVLRLSALPCLF